MDPFIREFHVPELIRVKIPIILYLRIFNPSQNLDHRMAVKVRWWKNFVVIFPNLFKTKYTFPKCQEVLLEKKIPSA